MLDTLLLLAQETAPPPMNNIDFDVIDILFGISGLAGGAIGAWLILLFLGKQSIGRAQKEAQDIIDRAKSEGDTLRKQLELDARNEQAARRETFEKEVEASRNEQKEVERRLTKREDNLDRKLDTLTTKEKYQIGRAHV